MFHVPTTSLCYIALSLSSSLSLSLSVQKQVVTKRQVIGSRLDPLSFLFVCFEAEHVPLMANPTPRKLRMTQYDYNHDRGRNRGWRRIVDGESGGNDNDGDGGNSSSSGGGGDGRRKVWEWNGRRVVLQVFPTETTPATLETPTPAEPGGGE